jgi:ADP-ribosylglycohydrolase
MEQRTPENSAANFEYLEKVYAGFLGMNIGIRLGAPVEPAAWTSERIARFYGDITGYIKDFKNFAADDDANGPVFFLRALHDTGFEQELTPQAVAEAWLNYTREGTGMFWWGGYGVSTEHTVYENLKRGIPAPQSGSMAVNGRTLAEQIGGQIFVDTWGLVCPGDPARAAKLARAAAGVSHDGEGLSGAAFIAAAIAAAFETSSAEKLIEIALKEIPPDSLYAQVVTAVRDFQRQHPLSWRECLQFLQSQWGYDRYPGICHIIPNAGICVMALVYADTFARGIEIAAMAGWDTDCNAGNVGTILGVARGLTEIPDHYRFPINDGIILSGISGSLNILDIPGYARELAAISRRLEKKPALEIFKIHEGIIDLDFLLPGSTHNIRLSNPNLCRMCHRAGAGVNGSGALEILFDRMIRGQQCRIYYKPFYRRNDFDDERYMPVFSPVMYPGQIVHIRFRLERFGGESVILSPYVRNTATGECIPLGGAVYRDGAWHELAFTIPPEDPRLYGAMIDEAGLIFEANSPAKNRDFGCLYLDRLWVTGMADYTIGMSMQAKEFGSITPFSHNHGAWELVRDASGVCFMEAMAADHGEAMTGSYFMKDAALEGILVPHYGNSHLTGIRVQGARRGYYGGFHGSGRVVILKHEGTELVELAAGDFDWTYEREYHIGFSAQTDVLSLSIDGQEVLSARDGDFAYGMASYALYKQGRCGFGDLKIREF